MDGFSVYVLKPRNILAALYKTDGSNKGIFLQHRMISEVPNSLKLTVVTPEGEVFVEPGEWVVKQDGDFYKCTDAEFKMLFDEVVAGVKCIFCGEKFPNVDRLKNHNAFCEANPANKKSA
jgi:hypothetical protein